MYQDLILKSQSMKMLQHSGNFIISVIGKSMYMFQCNLHVAVSEVVTLDLSKAFD